MTVVGKGGRPRKWASDADRVRAYRARLRGEAEPPTVSEVIEDETVVAGLWRRVHGLERLVTMRDDDLSELRSELGRLQRELDATTRRLAGAAGERDFYKAELERHKAARPPDREASASVNASANRAERRRLDRERRKPLT